MALQQAAVDPALLDLVGPRARPHYATAFARFAAGGRPWSWNWGAALGTYLWLAWRGCTLRAWVAGALSLAAGNVTDLAGAAIFLVLTLLFGLFGDRLYYDDLRRRLDRLRAATDPAAADRLRARMSGTHIDLHVVLLVLISVAVPIALLGPLL